MSWLEKSSKLEIPDYDYAGFCLTMLLLDP